MLESTLSVASVSADTMEICVTSVVSVSYVFTTFFAFLSGCLISYESIMYPALLPAATECSSASTLFESKLLSGLHPVKKNRSRKIKNCRYLFECLLIFLTPFVVSILLMLLYHLY